MWKYKVVAIDYDGTLVENVSPLTNGTKIKNADLVTKVLKSYGWEIIVFTCRPNYQRLELEDNLRKQNIIFDYIAFYTKPIASLYIDNKGIRFEGNWIDMLEWIEIKEQLPEVIEELDKHDK